MAQTLQGYGLLTGNPFVDNGLAAIAALADCETIDQLTLAKIRRVHRRDSGGNGMDLARANDRLKATWLIFPDSMITNPSYSKDPDRLVNYAKLTTAILGNIGHESIRQHCDICGNKRSVDLDLLFREALPNTENKDGKKRYVCRDWFPLAGSMKNDAQALPAASRSLNCCARCLYAVQYLPQAVFSVKGKLNSV